jgi:hypothetical protein
MRRSRRALVTAATLRRRSRPGWLAIGSHLSS